MNSAPSSTLICLAKAPVSEHRLFDYLAQWPDADVWTLNCFTPPRPPAGVPAFDLLARSSRHFEIHHPDCNGPEVTYDGFTGPVMLSPFVWTSAAQEKPFPLAAVYKQFKFAYMESTLDFMVSLALLRHVRGEQRIERLCLPGAEFSDPTHFGLRAGLSFWLGVALGLGIEIHKPATSALLRVCADGRMIRDFEPEQPHCYGQPWHVTAPVAKHFGWHH